MWSEEAMIDTKKPCVVEDCKGVMTCKAVPLDYDTAGIDSNSGDDTFPSHWSERIPIYEAWFCETGNHVQLV